MAVTIYAAKHPGYMMMLDRACSGVLQYLFSFTFGQYLTGVDIKALMLSKMTYFHFGQP